jgi:tRNA(Ile)-lysidine synthase
MLRNIAKKENRILVLGHHSLDYLESVLIHWIRGGGTNALKTMPLFKENIFRPLFLFSQKEILETITRENWKIFEDESNFQLNYLRNRIRHNVLPSLIQEGLNPDKLYKNFHSTFDDFIEEQITPPNSCKIFLPERLNIQNIKEIFDAYLRTMKLHPITRACLGEIQKSLPNHSPFTIENSEVYFWRGSKGPIYILRKNSTLLQEPRQLKQVITWNHREEILEPEETITTYIPGIKIQTKQGKKEISEVFRENNIPSPIRSFIPIVKRDQEITKVLFHLWDKTLKPLRAQKP